MNCTVRKVSGQVKRTLARANERFVRDRVTQLSVSQEGHPYRDFIVEACSSTRRPDIGEKVVPMW